MKTVAALLAACLAQAPAQAPAPETPRPPLKLRLDDADLRRMNLSTTPAAPKESDSSGLPTLGSDARRIELPPPSARPGTDSRSPYPPDTRPQ